MTPTPVLQSPTIDTLISSISTFSTILLGVLGLFLAVIGGIGGFLVWNGFALRKRAEDDLTAINNFRVQAAESLRKTIETGSAVVKTADKIVTIATHAQSKDKELTQLLSTYEQRKTAFSNASQGTAVFFETPLVNQYNSSHLNIGTQDNTQAIDLAQLTREYMKKDH